MDGHPLTAAMQEMLKAIRVLKQNRSRHSPGVPVGSVGVLAAINHRERGPCHVKDLATEHALDPSTISRTVAALVRAGLVTRSADPDDGRASTLHLTDHGRSVLDSVQQHYHDRLTAALQDWSPAEIAEFTAALHRFARDGALLSGRARVHESWRAIFENTKSIEFELSDLQVEIAGPIAWATCVERIQSIAGGEEIEAAAVATNLFVLEGGAWKLFLHHASPILRPEGE